MASEKTEDGSGVIRAYFVPSIPGFIPEQWKTDGTYPAGSWPSDALMVSKDVADKFWKQQAPEGMHLGSDGGKPVWVKSASKPSTTAEIEAKRLRAYAEPTTGSDRIFAEAMRMQIMGEPDYEEVRARAIARFEEIQAQYPRPAK